MWTYMLGVRGGGSSGGDGGGVGEGCCGGEGNCLTSAIASA